MTTMMAVLPARLLARISLVARVMPAPVFVEWYASCEGGLLRRANTAANHAEREGVDPSGIIWGEWKMKGR